MREKNLAWIAAGEAAKAWVEAEIDARALCLVLFAKDPYGQCTMRKAALAARVADEAVEACRLEDPADVWATDLNFLRKWKAEEAAEAWAEAALAARATEEATTALAARATEETDAAWAARATEAAAAALAARAAEEADAALAARVAAVVDTMLHARIAEAVKAALAARDTEEENRALLKTAKAAAKTAAKKARRVARAAAATKPELDEPQAKAHGVTAADKGDLALGHAPPPAT
jgi:hypothetical protein